MALFLQVGNCFLSYFQIIVVIVIVASNVFGSDANARLFQKVEKHIFISFCIFFWFAFPRRLQTCLAFTGADSLSVPFSDFGSVQIGRSIAFDTRSRVLVNHSRTDIFISPRSKIYRLNFANKFWGNFRLNTPQYSTSLSKPSYQTTKPGVKIFTHFTHFDISNHFFQAGLP